MPLYPEIWQQLAPSTTSLARWRAELILPVVYEDEKNEPSRTSSSSSAESCEISPDGGESKYWAIIRQP
jgi:hypothetical protein